MKTITTLLILAVIGHQIILPHVNSILLMELMFLFFYFVKGRRMIKDFIHDQKRKQYLKSVERRYISKGDVKLWRGRTSTEVIVEKSDLIDRL